MDKMKCQGFRRVNVPDIDEDIIFGLFEVARAGRSLFR